MTYCNASLTSSVLQCPHGDASNTERCSVEIRIKVWSSISQQRPTGRAMEAFAERCRAELAARWALCPWVRQGYSPPSPITTLRPLLRLCLTLLSAKCWGINTNTNTLGNVKITPPSESRRKQITLETKQSGGDCISYCIYIWTTRRGQQVNVLCEAPPWNCNYIGGG